MADPTPLASCLMPTANRRRFVPGAIARFLAQDYANAELVILDDGEDAVADLVPADERLRYIRAPRRLSLGEKRNQAADAARGGILLHWDDDDWYAPDRIGLQVQALLDSGADVCGVDRAFFIDPAGRAAWEYVYPQGNGHAPWVCGATLCYRRDYWRAHRFAGLQVGEDTAFAAAVPPQRLHVQPDNRFFAALIHQGNTSPKHVHDRRWQRADYGALLSRTGRFWEAVPSAAAAPERSSALVAAAGGIGDILRATPLIRALHLLGHTVDVVLAPDNPQAADLLLGAAEIASLHVVPDTTNGVAARLPAALTEPRYRIAAFTRWAAPLAPQIAAQSSLHFNPADWLARGDSACVAALARAAGWQGDPPAPFAHHSGRDFALPPGTIGLHPGCKPGWPWKRWHGFAELAGRLEHVALIGTAADRDGAGSYFGPLSWPAHVRDFAGKLSLADTAALIAQCAAVVANDSGLMHLAAVLGVPTIGIFGITSPQREAMALPAMHVLTKGLPCEPACRREPWGRRDCAQHLACLKTLTPGEVIDRLDAVLKEPAAMLDQAAPALPQAATPAPAVRLSLAVHMEGGVGDVILAGRLVEAAFRALGHCDIDVYYQNPEIARFVFHDTPFVRNFHPAASGRAAAGYDLSVHTLHYAGFTVHNPARLRQHFPDAALRLAQAAERFADHRGLFDRRPHLDGLWGRISAAAGRNALDNLGFCSGLDISRATELTLNPDVAALAAVAGLLGGAEDYITIHDGFDNSMTIPPGGATKCWTLEGWTAFVRGFKAAHPGIRVVQLGGSKSRKVAGVDVDLIGRTNLHQAAWILKNSALHVDTDSGLVHLARAMHAKAVVLFGPTEPRLYCHDTHAAVTAGDCASCWWSTADWLAHCPRGLRLPACMAAIAPERVLQEAAAMLDRHRPPRADMLSAELYDGALIRRDAAVLQAVFDDAGLSPVPITEHARNADNGAYLHASKQWEYLVALAAIRDLGQCGLRILDAGGGRGALAFHLATLGHEVEVIDRDFLWDHGGDEEIERRFMQATPPNLRARHGGLHNLPVADESVDVVVCISVVEHLREKATVLRELMRVLRPGGLLVLTFDIAAVPEAFEDHMRVEIFSPQRLSGFLRPICGEIAPFSAGDVDESAARIQTDGVAGIPRGMTVGGLVLRKRP
jgi:ADP-heptose:LPS heptosyltransferase